MVDWWAQEMPGWAGTSEGTFEWYSPLDWCHTWAWSSTFWGLQWAEKTFEWFATANARPAQTSS